MKESDDHVPGPELSAVGVAGELEVEASADGGEDAAGLVCEQDAGVVFLGVCDGSFGVGFVFGDVLSGGVIGAAGDEEFGAVVVDDAVFVEEDVDAVFGELFAPCGSVPVVFVVSGGEEDAVFGFEVGDGFDVVPE